MDCAHSRGLTMNLHFLYLPIIIFLISVIVYLLIKLADKNYQASAPRSIFADDTGEEQTRNG
jgi:hypothetical protein